MLHQGGRFRQVLTTCPEIHLKTTQSFREAQRNFSKDKKNAFFEKTRKFLRINIEH